MRDREHLDHLPGRSYLLVVGAAAALATGVAVLQMVSTSDWASTVLWGAVMVLGAVSLIALAVAWEERRAHIHALVREVLEEDPAGRSRQMHAAALAELMRLGAHREIDLLNQHVGPEGAG